MIGAHLNQYYATVKGDLQSCNRIAMRIKPLLISQELNIIHQIMWRISTTIFTTIEYQYNEALETVLPLLKIVKNNNLVFMECLALAFNAATHLSFSEISHSVPLINRMEKLISSSQPADIAWFYLAKAMLAAAKGEHSSTLNFGKKSLQLTSEVGATLIEMEICILLALANCELGRFKEAFEYLENPRKLKFANSPYIRYEAHQAEAYAHLLQNEYPKSHDLIRKTFTIARQYGYFGSWVCWNQRMVTRLCAEALRVGIEVDYVRQLISKRQLLPEDPYIENWPWPVRIYTLGQFKVEINEHAKNETKAQRKPFAVLQALIALGGSEVKVDRIAEILWPDAEGDAAISAFTTTVSRLRKLIGEETIIVKGGRVSLDERRCWVDVRALESQLNKESNPEHSSAREYAEKLLLLYRGPFLSDEEGEWARHMRNKLRMKFIRGLLQCVKILHSNNDREHSDLLLQRAIDIDASVEHLCREYIPA